ncbi:achacin-like [Liolophura sinensis]|uniref:achacin-like n=1 Tax=Liolophura sinensis TaxID=3198878 RepID=UPI003158FBF6
MLPGILFVLAIAVASGFDTRRLFRKKPATHDCLDVAIVGGGIGGTYTGWRLRQRGLNIAIFENTDRVGGRMFSVFLPSVPNVPAELGAMRYVPGAHSTLESLFPQLDLRTEVFQPDSFKKLFYFRSTRLSAEELDSPKLPYNLAPGESRNPDELSWTFSQRVMNVSRPDLIPDIEEAYTPDGVPVYQQGWTVTALAQTVTALAQVVKMLAQTVKTLAQTVTMLAQTVTALAQVVKTLAQTVKTLAKTVKTLAQTVKTLAQTVTALAQGVKILVQTVKMLAQTVKMLAQTVKTLAQTVTALAQVVKMLAQTVKTLAQTVTALAQTVTALAQVVKTLAQTVKTLAQTVKPQTVCAKAVMMALPAPAMQKIHWYPFQFDPLMKMAFDAVTDFSAMKIFLAYPNAWWDDFGAKSKAYVTDIPLRQGAEFGRFRNSSGDESALMMVSYADGEVNNDYWRELRNFRDTVSSPAIPAKFSGESMPPKCCRL